MGQKVTFNSATKIIEIDVAPVNGIVEIDVKIDIYSDGKEDWKTDATLNKFLFPVAATGGDPLPGGKALGSTFFLEYGWVIQPYNADHVLSINGNMYARDGSNPYIPTVDPHNVQIIQSVSSLVDSTVQQLPEIERMSFAEAVWVDINSGLAGTAYPTGNSEYPVDNIPDAVTIAVGRGFRKINILSDIILDLGDDVSNFHLFGVSHLFSDIDVRTDAVCLNTSFTDFNLTGILDGGSEIKSCNVSNLTYFNGHIQNSSLGGTITLAGGADADIVDCRIQDFDNIPIIDAGGTGQNLMLANFSGIIQIQNLTGPSKLGIGLDAGQAIIDSTCTAGSIQASGSGSIVDNSGPNCYVIDSVVNGTDVQNLAMLIEMQRRHHTGTGDIWYWDPENGNDAFDGKHVDRATKTFSQAHNYVTDNNHDIIMCLAGRPDGVTITNENLVITKNYLFVRGPGRDFRVVNTNDLVSSIDIQAEGIEISGMIVKTNTTNPFAAITSTGNYSYLVDLYIEDSSNGIHIFDSDNAVIEHVRISHGTGYGIKFSGTSSHSIVTNTHIGYNGGTGIIIDFTTGHEVIIDDMTVIHDNGGWGIEIGANSNATRISQSTSIYNNTLGTVDDNAPDTYYEIEEINKTIAIAIWDTPIENVIAGSYGEIVKFLAFDSHVHIDTNNGLPGTVFPLGTHSHPVNNMADAVIIGLAEGIHSILIAEDATVLATDDISGFTIEGAHANKSQLTVFAGAVTALTQINDCFINGTLGGSVVIRDSVIDDVVNFTGIMFQTLIKGSVTVGAAPTASYLITCYTEGDTPIEVDLSDPGSQCHVRDFHGGIKVVNKAGPESMTITMSAGKILLDGTVTNGAFTLAGNALLLDTSSGTTIDDDALINSQITLIQIDVSNIIDIVTTIKKFDTNRTKIDENNFTLTVYDDDLVTPLQVYDLKDHNGVASYLEIFERVPV